MDEYACISRAAELKCFGQRIAHQVEGGSRVAKYSFPIADVDPARSDLSLNQMKERNAAQK
jgi:hypothetical protein